MDTRWKFALGQLKSVWEGNAAVKYLEESEQINNNLEEMIEYFNDIANRLNLAADRYEEIDNIW